MTRSTLVYQTARSAGRDDAKWHAVADGHVLCIPLPIGVASVREANDVPDDQRCQNKKCAAAWEGA